jgi:hypothetical protein
LSGTIIGVMWKSKGVITHERGPQISHNNFHQEKTSLALGAMFFECREWVRG